MYGVSTRIDVIPILGRLDVSEVGCSMVVNVDVSMYSEDVAAVDCVVTPVSTCVEVSILGSAVVISNLADVFSCRIDAELSIDGPVSSDIDELGSDDTILTVDSIAVVVVGIDTLDKLYISDSDCIVAVTVPVDRCSEDISIVDVEISALDSCVVIASVVLINTAPDVSKDDCISVDIVELRSDDSVTTIDSTVVVIVGIDVSGLDSSTVVKNDDDVSTSVDVLLMSMRVDASDSDGTTVATLEDNKVSKIPVVDCTDPDDSASSEVSAFDSCVVISASDGVVVIENTVDVCS